MNKVMLIGYIGREPEVKYYDADQCLATVSLATTEKGYAVQNGTKGPDHTDGHTVICWKNLAKVVERYVHKGDKLYVEGRIRYRAYDDKKGMRRNVTEILAENMEILSSKPQSSNTENSTSQNSSQTGVTEKDITNLPF